MMHIRIITLYYFYKGEKTVLYCTQPTDGSGPIRVRVRSTDFLDLNTLCRVNGTARDGEYSVGTRTSLD